jgi:hypothetical protein
MASERPVGVAGEQSMDMGEQLHGGAGDAVHNATTVRAGAQRGLRPG